MALILLDGGEDVATWGVAGSATISAGRSGNSVNLGFNGTLTFVIPAAQEADTITLGFALKPSVSLVGGIFLNFKSDNNTTSHVQVQTSGSAGTVYRGDFTSLGSLPTGTFPLEQWEYFEIQCKLHDTTGFVTVRVNGVQILSNTNIDTKNAGTKTTFDTVQISSFGNPTYFDDFYLMAGSSDTFLGDIVVETIYPNGNGSVNQWLGSDADSVNNYLLVNEVGAPVVTTYTADAVGGHQDIYALADLAHGSGTILGVCHSAHMAKSDAVNARQFRLVNHRAIDTKSAPITLTNSYASYHYVLTNDPEGFKEPFENLTNWSDQSANWTIVAGRTGNCAQTGGSNPNNYTIPSALESATVTMGVAWQANNLGTGAKIVALCSDAAATQHLSLEVNSDGSLSMRRGSGGTILGSSAAGVITAINTWHYIEIQALLSDTVGTVEVRVNGATVIGPLTAQDTKNAGTKTTFDSVKITGALSTTSKYDDMYLITGAGQPFLGSQSVPAGGSGTPWSIPSVNALQSGVEVV